MEDKSIFELIAEYSAGTISSADAELLRERLESDAEAMRLFREIRETEKVLKSVQAQEKIDLQKSWQRFDVCFSVYPTSGTAGDVGITDGYYSRWSKGYFTE